MADELSALNLKDDLAEIISTPDMARWKIDHVGPLELHVALSSIEDPGQVYHVRLLWSEYPGRPPSLKFRDGASGRLDLPSAWPQVRGFRPNNLDTCVNYSAEGFATHPEWARDRRFCWDPRGNAALRVLRILQSEMDDHYQGRCAA